MLTAGALGWTPWPHELEPELGDGSEVARQLRAGQRVDAPDDRSRSSPGEARHDALD